MSVFAKYPKSSYIKGIKWIGDRIPYPEREIKGDTFPMTWARDGEIYTSAGDPLWGESQDGLDIEKFSGGPSDYKITKVNHMNEYKGWGGDGPKPCGMISVDGIIYFAFQNIRRMQKAPHSLISQHGSDACIIYSGAKEFFLPTPSFGNIKESMFPGYKFGGPSFINFGKDNENARDGFVYAVSGDQWDNGSNLRLGRVPKEKITDPGSWEWVCAFSPGGDPAWTGILEDSIPVLSIHRHLGLPEMVYMTGINRYLLFTWHLHKDFSPYEGTDLIVYESPEPWGPFSLVYHEENWEGKISGSAMETNGKAVEFNPYCPRLPLKWVEPDGVTCWLQFSGSWGPEGQTAGYYRSNVREFRLIMA